MPDQPPDAPNGSPTDATGRPVQGPLAVFKPLQATAGATVAILAAHAPEGRLKPNVRPYVMALAGAGVQVVLVAATDAPFAADRDVTDQLSGGYVRRNEGYDFASWAHLLAAEPGLYSARTLILTNDSLIVSAPHAVASFLETVASIPAPVVGATESRAICWHLQSFFLAFKGEALATAALQDYFGNVRILADKASVIRAYELPLASQLAAAGLECRSVFPNPRGKDPMVFQWREMVRAGCPFVKTLVLRGSFSKVDISDWRQELDRAGFDVGMAERTVAGRARADAPHGDWGLLSSEMCSGSGT